MDDRGGGFSRNHYFNGKMLTAEDFQAEQDYNIGKRRLLNRCLYGSRIVCGLTVKINGRYIFVDGGLAIDCCGREIYVPSSGRITLPKQGDVCFLTISYREFGTDPIPIPTFPEDPQQERFEHSRIRESFKLGWATENPLKEHEWRDGAWVTCGKSHSLGLAQVASKQGRFSVNKVFAKKIHAGRTCWCKGKG